jgi:hypothetical protein
MGYNSTRWYLNIFGQDINPMILYRVMIFARKSLFFVELGNKYILIYHFSCDLFVISSIDFELENYKFGDLYIHLDINSIYGRIVMTEDKEVRPITYPEIAALLHGILFSYEKVDAELYKGKHKILFPYIIEDMTKVLGSQGFIVVDQKQSLEENMEGLRTYLSDEETLKDIKFEKIDDDTFVFDIGECAFAVAGVHDILKLHGGVCPFALAVAGLLTSAMKEGQYIDLADSEYSDKGSKTVLKIV